ncbi:unnamed protein product, partial [Prorocentrum cordatum]
SSANSGLGVATGPPCRDGVGHDVQPAVDVQGRLGGEVLPRGEPPPPGPDRPAGGGPGEPGRRRRLHAVAGGGPRRGAVPEGGQLARLHGAVDVRTSEGALAALPAHLAPLARFPVADKDLMSARVVKTSDGKTPTIRFKKEIVQVTWGSGHIVTYKPEFILEEPPDWQPDDILKQRPRGRARRSASSGASAASGSCRGRP